MTRRIFALGVLALLISAPLTMSAPATEPATGPATKPSAPPAVGEAARDFGLEDLDGNRVELGNQTEKGPLVLIVLRGYPGYQCPLCTKQVAELRGKADAIRQRGARVLLVYPGPSDRLEDYARQFLKNQKLPDNFSLATDPDYTLTYAYALRWNAPGETAYPSTFVIGKDKVVRYAKVSKTHGDRASADDVLKALE